MSVNKKAQTSMVFVFILATVIIGIIALMGYIGINKIITSADDAARVDLYKQIDSDIGDIRRQRLSSRVESYRLPTPIDEVCFVKNVTAFAPNKAIELAGSNGHNIFFLDGAGLIVHSLDAGPIQPSVSGANIPSICSSVSPVRVRITGQGAVTQIEEEL